MAKRIVSSKKAPAPLDSNYLKVDEAAVYLRATKWFVRSLAWEKRVPAVRLGKRIVFLKSDLDKFMAEQKTGTAR